jgi:hypothetical protein
MGLREHGVLQITIRIFRKLLLRVMMIIPMFSETHDIVKRSTITLAESHGDMGFPSKPSSSWSSFWVLTGRGYVG